MYIITKLDVNKNIVQLLDRKQYNDKKQALTKIFSDLNKQKEKAYINKIQNNQYIEVYKINSGLLYDTKYLSHIFQILEIDNNRKNQIS